MSADDLYVARIAARNLSHLIEAIRTLIEDGEWNKPVKCLIPKLIGQNESGEDHYELTEAGKCESLVKHFRAQLNHQFHEARAATRKVTMELRRTRSPGEVFRSGDLVEATAHETASTISERLSRC